MYILKNAIRSIVRVKGRNVLIGIIIVVIAVASCIALSVKNSANKLIESYENSSEIIANISVDRSNMQKDFKEIKENENFDSPRDFVESLGNVSLDTQILYANSEYVKSYYYTSLIYLNGNENLTKISMDMEFKRNDYPENINIPNHSKTGDRMGSLADFTVIGYSSLDAMTEFINGTYKLTEGEMVDIDTLNICIISDELAEENEILVGDTIILVNPNNEEDMYELSVSGIYTDNSESENTMSMFSNSDNQILTNTLTIDNIVNNSESNVETSIELSNKLYYVLNNKDVIESFQEELKEKGLNDYYTVSTNLDSIQNELEPIKNLSSFATTLLIIVLGVGGVILVVINMINIRERKYEIGVLRSIGMKKSHVLLQFVIELFLVTFISILIGAFIGSLLTVPVSNKLLQNEIKSVQTQVEDITSNFGMKSDKEQIGIMPNVKNDIRQTFSSTDYIDKLNAVVDLKTICELIIIGIVLTICSSIISIIFISRYSPLKILSSRS